MDPSRIDKSLLSSGHLSVRVGPILASIAILVSIAALCGLWQITKNENHSPKTTPSVNVVESDSPPVSPTTEIAAQTQSMAPNITESIFTPTPVESTIQSSNPWKPLAPLPSNEMGLITNGDRSQDYVVLTFDLCQREGDLAGYDTEIIRVLNEANVPATFFLGGLWMQTHEAETLELYNNPLFELGNHAWSHLDFSQITSEQMTSEIILTQQEMWDLLGWQTNLFRLPYGTYTEEALDVIAENGLYTIQWDVVSGDPDPNILAEPMVEWVLQQVQPGSIIIMHANERGWNTAEALPDMIQKLKDRGYTFVTISELLRLESTYNQSP